MVKRRNRRSSRKPSLKHIKRVMNHESKGFQIKVNPDPPSFSAAPWWPLTVNLLAAKDEGVTMAALDTAIKAQLGWTNFVDSTGKNTIPISVRMISVRAWGMAKQPIQLAIFDSLGGKHRFAEVNDFGSGIQYSCLGWHFGSITNSDSVRFSDTDVLFEVSGGRADAKILIYVQCLIRTVNASKPIALKSGNLRVPVDDFCRLGF